ncbi:MAG: hypothetical protein MZW92_79905 [Comamonadaceae bacterium]|nr:hypothetical protein [Comamonadaceae bacterium]
MDDAGSALHASGGRQPVQQRRHRLHRHEHPRPAAVQRRQPAHLQGRQHPVSTRCSTRSATTIRSSASSSLWEDVAAGDRARTSRREPLVMRLNTFDCAHVPPHQPGARDVRDGRLPGAHADRHHRPAHPPAEVGPDHHRRRGQRLELRGRHALAAGTVRERIHAINLLQRGGRDRRRQRGRDCPAAGSAGAGCCTSEPHPFFAGRTGLRRQLRRRLAGRAHHASQRWFADPVRQRPAASIAAWASSSPTTTTVPRPSSRSACTPRCWSSRPARSWVHNETGTSSAARRRQRHAAGTGPRRH